MKEHLLQIGEFPPFVQAMIDERYQCHHRSDIERDEGLRIRVRGIITRSNYEVPADLVRTLPHLGIIATCGVGYDGIPVELARDLGIRVTNTPDVLNSAVAELAIGMMLSLLRRLPAADRYVRAGRWGAVQWPLGESLAGKRVGMVGLGRIGKEIAARLEGFDVRLAYHGRTDQGLRYRFQPDILALANDSDILVVTAPGGPATRHLIGREVLRALGPDAYLVNIARGSLVDEDSLLEALAGGIIAGAALDVYENEPRIDQRFLELENVLLLPHIGSATHQTRHAMAILALNNLEHFFRDGSVLTPV
ncbi:2-hydroxyacid dehydrogenase [Castellaniella sp. S9]|uniref:2-hydroxyacid dehydrogenase n=1 Tax=Castellaniella sp. S9 TaxID=2993652 RepID=UPI0022B35A43|nr:2-hydroxyacid dehydrogenase [Castellaniella sp. S9]